MADDVPDEPLVDRRTDNGSEKKGPTLAPLRRHSLLAPKLPSSLPGVADIAGFQSSTATRSHSLPNGTIPPLIVPGYTMTYLDGLPLRTYTIVGKQYTMQCPPNETNQQLKRETQDRRILKYVLHVLQQPIRARACGNGPRASNDRRPVDPPPVVQLQIFDITNGEGNEAEQDITMTYDSGFMLYASLDYSRPIANGRMQINQHPPVLTGVAVASAAYLNLPVPAAFFVFSDLSVRHEGWYRLKFSLFEAVKRDCNANLAQPDPHSGTATSPGRTLDRPDELTNRMEVVSEPFQVWSAKKFPGLMESTEISKEMAEQGCRVRIRRDIRQRKRVSDKSKDDDSTRATPDLHTIPEHSRTQSIDSHHQERRRDSLGSQYSQTRPFPSRQPSLASLPQTSPITPGPSQTSMGPPRVHKSSLDSSPSTVSYPPVPPIDTRWPQQSSYPRWSSNVQPYYPGQTLPPLQQMAPMTSSYDYNNRQKLQYDLPAATATKRRRSPGEYNQTDAMKHGARPDTAAPAPFQCPKQGDYIQVGDDEDNDDDDYLSAGYFRRATGGWSSKQSFPEMSVRRVLNCEPHQSRA